MTAGSAPLLVVEGTAAEMADAVADVAAAGWVVRAGWAPPHPPVPALVLAGELCTQADARAAMLAAVAGAGLVVHARAARDLVDIFCDDLRHLGSLDHRIGPLPVLGVDARALLALLADGATLGRAARAAHLSRRSADRRLAEGREQLGVGSTEEAILAYRARLDRVGRPG